MEKITGTVNHLLADLWSKLQAIDQIRLVRPYTMLPFTRLLTLVSQVKYCEERNIQGDYMECGVWKGGAVGLMASGNKKYGSRRRHLHLFDVFDDICAPDSIIDGERAVSTVFKYTQISSVESLCRVPKDTPLSGFYRSFGGNGTIDACKELIISKIGYDRRFVHFHKGWFKDTMPKSARKIGKLAILRIDADWYRSVKIALDYFYPKVVSGGFVIIDDYGHYEGCTKAVDEYLKKKGIRIRRKYVDPGCMYFVKP